VDRANIKLGLEVLTAVKMSVLVLWILTPCRLVYRYQCFHQKDSEDRSSVFSYPFVSTYKSARHKANIDNIQLLKSVEYTFGNKTCGRTDIPTSDTFILSTVYKVCIITIKANKVFKSQIIRKISGSHGGEYEV
jgi:hypothetical protein